MTAKMLCPSLISGQKYNGEETGNSGFLPTRKSCRPCARAQQIYITFSVGLLALDPPTPASSHPKGSDIMRFRLDYSGAAAPAYTGFP